MEARLALVARRHALYDPVAERVRRGHPLLLLPSVAEPHSDHLLLQLEAVREGGDLLGGGFRLFVEMLLEGALHRHLDRGPLLPFPALGGYLVYTGRRAVVESASSSHFCSNGFNLHMFLKLSCNASNLHIVVWENTFP